MRSDYQLKNERDCKMTRILLLIIALGLTHTISAQEKESFDLDALYQQIDDAILQSPQYVAERKQKIASYQDSLQMEKSVEGRFPMAEKLFWLYEPYKNDSALHYAELCISLADSLHRPDLIGRYRSLLAYQCSRTDRWSHWNSFVWLTSLFLIIKVSSIIIMPGCTSVEKSGYIPSSKMSAKNITICRITIAILC